MLLQPFYSPVGAGFIQHWVFLPVSSHLIMMEAASLPQGPFRTVFLASLYTRTCSRGGVGELEQVIWYLWVLAFSSNTSYVIPEN